MSEKTIQIGDSIDQVVAEIRALKGTDVTALNCGWNALWREPIAKLTALIAALEETGITHLNFCGNSLGKKPTAELIVLFAALKNTGVTHLNLSLNNFKSKSTKELQAIFAAIPENVLSVIIDEHELKAMSESQRLKIRKRFNQTDTHPEPSPGPSLPTDDANIEQALGLKMSAHSIANLMNEKTIIVGNKPIDQLVAEIRALKNATALDLGWSVLWKKTTAELTALIGAVERTGITQINLEGNNLGKKSTKELVAVFSALKKTNVTHLNLCLNGFKNRSAEELQTIFAGIPERVISVSFYYSELKIMNSSQLQALRSRFNQPNNIILYNDEDLKLEPSLYKKDANAYQTLGFKSPAPSSSTTMNISMMVLGGFIAVAGVATVALAFTVLNAATFGVAGLVTAGVGIAAVLSGIGLFATGTNRQTQPRIDRSLYQAI